MQILLQPGLIRRCATKSVFHAFRTFRLTHA
jgi:hypothetical protein